MIGPIQKTDLIAPQVENQLVGFERIVLPPPALTMALERRLVREIILIGSTTLSRCFSTEGCFEIEAPIRLNKCERHLYPMMCSKLDSSTIRSRESLQLEAPSETITLIFLRSEFAEHRDSIAAEARNSPG